MGIVLRIEFLSAARSGLANNHCIIIYYVVFEGTHVMAASVISGVWPLLLLGLAPLASAQPFVGTASNGSLVLQPAAGQQVLVDGVVFRSLIERLEQYETKVKALESRAAQHYEPTLEALEARGTQFVQWTPSLKFGGSGVQSYARRYGTYAFMSPSLVFVTFTIELSGFSPSSFGSTTVASVALPVPAKTDYEQVLAAKTAHMNFNTGSSPTGVFFVLPYCYLQFSSAIGVSWNTKPEHWTASSVLTVTGTYMVDT